MQIGSRIYIGNVLLILIICSCSNRLNKNSSIERSGKEIQVSEIKKDFTEREIRALCTYIIDDMTWKFDIYWDTCNFSRDTIILSVSNRNNTNYLKRIYWKANPKILQGYFEPSKLEGLSTQVPLKMMTDTVSPQFNTMDSVYPNILFIAYFEGLFKVTENLYFLQMQAKYNMKNYDMCISWGTVLSPHIYQIVRGRNGILYIYSCTNSYEREYYKESVNSQIYCPDIQDGN